jgi:hypothetical protein
MKKIYTKPSLHAEKFAVEGIMTEAALPEALSSITALYLGNEVQGNISFTDANTLQSINYADFI